MFSTLNYVLQRASPAAIERIFRERLSEPLHLNIIALFVLLFGSTRAKIYFDLTMRQQFAFGLLHAADMAKAMGVRRVTAIEFGVARGAGLRNMCQVASVVTRATGIEFDIAGFDTAVGLPRPRDYRDHPDIYKVGDYGMIDREGLKKALPSNAQLIVGPIEETLPGFLEKRQNGSPIGFASIDVDYYFSTVDAFKAFEGPATFYLPITTLYFDDAWEEPHNPWCGELLAKDEFNAAHPRRKIAPYTHLKGKRLFKNARWIDNIYTLHILDHPLRSVPGDEVINHAPWTVMSLAVIAYKLADTLAAIEVWNDLQEIFGC